MVQQHVCHLQHRRHMDAAMSTKFKACQFTWGAGYMNVTFSSLLLSLEVRNQIAADLNWLQTLRNGAAGVAHCHTLPKHANA